MPSESMNSIPNFLYGTAWKEDRTRRADRSAIRAGFRAIDTANQRRHYFEEGVGEGFAAAYRAGIVTRANLFLQTHRGWSGGNGSLCAFPESLELRASSRQLQR